MSQLKRIKVTVSDPDAGEELSSAIVENNYVLITAGNRYLKHKQVAGTTEILTVAVDKGAPVQ